MYVYMYMITLYMYLYNVSDRCSSDAVHTLTGEELQGLCGAVCEGRAEPDGGGGPS